MHVRYANCEFATLLVPHFKRVYCQITV